MKKICILLFICVMAFSCACTGINVTVPPEVMITAAPAGTPGPGMPISELMGGEFTQASEKVFAGETASLHYYHDNSYDGEMHASQLIYETAWKMLLKIEVTEETEDPGICDANYFCRFTFKDSTEIAFCFIADEYFCHDGKTYRIADISTAKALRIYLSDMMDRYDDEALKNAEIGRGMTEHGPIDCRSGLLASVTADLNGDGRDEVLIFKMQNGGDMYASGAECTFDAGGESVSIGRFSPEPGQVRVFSADTGEGRKAFVIVNYSSPARGNETVFVYMKEGEVCFREYPDVFPVAFDAESGAFLMTDETVLSCAECMH